MREIRGGIFQGHFHNLLISKNNTFWALHISRITFQVVTYRYLMASDLTWRTLDIVQGHSLRWLVEVFVQDWKGHEGWAQLTKQPGEKHTPKRDPEPAG